MHIYILTSKFIGWKTLQCPQWQGITKNAEPRMIHKSSVCASNIITQFALSISIPILKNKFKIRKHGLKLIRLSHTEIVELSAALMFYLSEMKARCRNIKLVVVVGTDLISNLFLRHQRSQINTHRTKCVYKR